MPTQLSQTQFINGLSFYLKLAAGFDKVVVHGVPQHDHPDVTSNVSVRGTFTESATHTQCISALKEKSVFGKAEKAEEALSLAANGEIVEFKFFDDVNEREASVTMEVAELNGFV